MTREDAKREMMFAKRNVVADSWIDQAYDVAIKALSEPEQKKGEWIPEFDGKFTGGAYWFSCSKCKRIVPEVRNGGWNFCPQCGAEMSEE